MNKLFLSEKPAVAEELNDREKYWEWDDAKKYEYLVTDELRRKQWNEVLADYQIEDRGEETFSRIMRGSMKSKKFMKEQPLLVAFVVNQFPLETGNSKYLNRKLKISDDMYRAMANIRVRSNNMEPEEYDQMLKEGLSRDKEIYPDSPYFLNYSPLARTYFFQNFVEHINYKRWLVLSMLNEKTVNQEVMKNYPCVSIGSGEDVAMPLCLGARKITMVDFDFASGLKLSKNVFKNITKIIGRMPQIEGNKMSFDFDFGKGKERVSVWLEGKKYGNTMFDGNCGDDYEEGFAKAQQFKLPSQIGMIMGSLAMCYVKDDKAAADNLVYGGLILEMPCYKKIASRNKKYDLEYLKLDEYDESMVVRKVAGVTGKGRGRR
jgi:hypothetical protein